MDPEAFDSSRLSSYFRELAEASHPVALSGTLPVELRSLCGPWVSTTAAVAKASFALAGVKAAGPIVDMALAVSGIGDAQTDLLKSIKADLELLRQEPLKSAITWMRQAELVGPGDEHWARCLDHAAEDLVKAKNLAKSSEEQAIVHFGLACVYLTWGNSTLARYWIDESGKSKEEILRSLEVKAVRRFKDIQRFLPFYNTAEICAATIHGRTRAKAARVSLDRPSSELVDSVYGSITLSGLEYHKVFEYFNLPTVLYNG